MKITIIKASNDDYFDLVRMALDLWADSDYDDLKLEMKSLLNHEDNVFFLGLLNGETSGFIHLSIRRDYVEGSRSSPTAYIEGIYVNPNSRGHGLARALFKAGEEWAKSKGTAQIGSDIELGNEPSYEFHNKMGFTKANKIVCFIKDI